MDDIPATIDIGSNTVHMLAVRWRDGRIDRVDATKPPGLVAGADELVLTAAGLRDGILIEFFETRGEKRGHITPSPTRGCRGTARGRGPVDKRRAFRRVSPGTSAGRCAL